MRTKEELRKEYYDTVVRPIYPYDKGRVPELDNLVEDTIKWIEQVLEEREKFENLLIGRTKGYLIGVVQYLEHEQCANELVKIINDTIKNLTQPNNNHE